MSEPTLFGYTEAQWADLGVSYGIPLLILFMLFIIGHTAWRSNAGKYGTAVLYFVLALGMVGYVGKMVLQRVLVV
ncbi:MAG: DUF2788 domain-containing protein [Thiobacillaceae bacterium]|nr:DUF2788 domain-containing protein [Thiobacillaceae bacterium]